MPEDKEKGGKGVWRERNPTHMHPQQEESHDDVHEERNQRELKPPRHRSREDKRKERELIKKDIKRKTAWKEEKAKRKARSAESCTGINETPVT